MDYKNFLKIENEVIIFKDVESRKMQEKYKYRIIGIIYGKNKKEVQGYILLNLYTFQIKAVSTRSLIPLMDKPGFMVNAQLDNGKIELTECSPNRMTEYDSLGNPKDRIGLHVISRLEITDGTETEKIGYCLVGSHGLSIDVTKNGLLQLAKTKKLINVKIVKKEGKIIVSGIKKEIPVEVIKIRNDKDARLPNSGATRISAGTEKISIKNSKVEPEKKVNPADAWRKARHIEKIEEILDRKIDYAKINNNYTDYPEYIDYSGVTRTRLVPQDFKWYLNEMPEEHKKYVVCAMEVVKDFTENSGYKFSKKDVQVFTCMLVREMVRAEQQVIDVYQAHANKFNWGDDKWIYRMPYFKSLQKMYPANYANIVKYKEKLKEAFGVVVERSQIQKREFVGFIEDIGYRSDAAFEKAGFTRDISKHGTTAMGYAGEVKLTFCGYVMPSWDSFKDDIRYVGDFMLATEMLAMLYNNGFILTERGIVQKSLIEAEQYWIETKTSDMHFSSPKSKQDRSVVCWRNQDSTDMESSEQKLTRAYLPNYRDRLNQIIANLELIKICNKALGRKLENYMERFANKFYTQQYLPNVVIDEYTDSSIINEPVRVFYESGARAILEFSAEHGKEYKINCYNKEVDRKKNKDKKRYLENYIEDRMKGLLETLAGRNKLHKDIRDLAKILSNATLKNIVYAK